MMKWLNKDDSGMTLVELIVYMVISSMFVSLIYYVFNTFNTTSALNINQAQASSIGQIVNLEVQGTLDKSDSCTVSDNFLICESIDPSYWSNDDETAKDSAADTVTAMRFTGTAFSIATVKTTVSNFENNGLAVSEDSFHMRSNLSWSEISTWITSNNGTFNTRSIVTNPNVLYSDDDSDDDSDDGSNNVSPVYFIDHSEYQGNGAYEHITYGFKAIQGDSSSVFGGVTTRYFPESNY